MAGIRQTGQLGLRYVLAEPGHRLGDAQQQDPVLLTVHDPHRDGQTTEPLRDLGQPGQLQLDPGLRQANRDATSENGETRASSSSSVARSQWTATGHATVDLLLDRLVTPARRR